MIELQIHVSLNQSKFKRYLMCKDSLSKYVTLQSSTMQSCLLYLGYVLFQVFPMNIGDIDWPKYIENYVKGVQLYLLRDKLHKMSKNIDVGPTSENSNKAENTRSLCHHNEAYDETNAEEAIETRSSVRPTIEDSETTRI